MKSIAIIFLSSLSLSCGYTVVKKIVHAQLPSQPMPDLVIVSISDSPDSELWMDDPDGRPSFFFDVTVANIGNASFHARLEIAWADNSPDIAWHDFPNVLRAQLPDGTIGIGDTVTIRLDARHHDYSPGTPLRFLLVTQKVMDISKRFFDSATDSEELRYDNNCFDYIMR
jgi:hypothetical protein